MSTINVSYEVLEQIKTKPEEKAFVVVRHVGTNSIMFLGWVDGPDYKVQLTWLA